MDGGMTEEQAYALGRTAFAENRMSVPILDREMQVALEGVAVGDQRTIRFLRGWTRGYDDARREWWEARAAEDAEQEDLS